jgi:predicted nucleotidyltransferase
MQPIVGILCEYDPFHRGHARQFTLIREQLPDARILCVMSGCFTQRGMPALFSPAYRAHAALAAGADAVLELPAAFAVRDAENFALGGVSLLHRLGMVTHLSFGAETADLTQLQTIASLLESPDAVFQKTLRSALGEGRPFVEAQARAAAESLTVQEGGNAITRELLEAMLELPNNILGICYLRALMRLQSPIHPLPVQRVGNYHAADLTAVTYPSASAVRKAYLAGDFTAAQAACGYALTPKAIHRPDALDSVLIHRLRTMGTPALRALPDCSEGLENRLQQTAQKARGRAELIGLAKAKRYPYARLNRLATHALLDVTAKLLAAHPAPEYARLLGFRQSSCELLTEISADTLPFIAKAADADPANPLFALDARTYDLWALGAGLPAGLLYTQQVVIV